MPRSIEATARKFGLPRLASSLAGLLRNEIGLHTRKKDEKRIKIGVSKFGGLPDLPAGMCWPHDPDDEEKLCLPFVAQINLAEVKAHDKEKRLPAHGMLYLFLTCPERLFPTSDAADLRVLYVERPVDLQRAKRPAQLLAEETPFASCAVDYSHRSVLPPLDSIFASGLKFKCDETDAYLDLRDNWGQDESGHSATHSMLGYPRTLQRSRVELDCQLHAHGLHCERDAKTARAKPLQRGARDWLPLFSIGSDQNVDMDFGFARIFVMIRRQHLKSRTFDQAWMVLQST